MFFSMGHESYKPRTNPGKDRRSGLHGTRNGLLLWPPLQRSQPSAIAAHLTPQNTGHVRVHLKPKVGADPESTKAAPARPPPRFSSCEGPVLTSCPSSPPTPRPARLVPRRQATTRSAA